MKTKIIILAIISFWGLGCNQEKQRSDKGLVFDQETKFKNSGKDSALLNRLEREQFFIDDELDFIYSDKYDFQIVCLKQDRYDKRYMYSFKAMDSIVLFVKKEFDEQNQNSFFTRNKASDENFKYSYRSFTKVIKFKEITPLLSALDNATGNILKEDNQIIDHNVLIIYYHRKGKRYYISSNCVESNSMKIVDSTLRTYL
jgi:hypothetical protein